MTLHLIQPRYALQNAEGKTVLEGPKYLLQSLAVQFEERYPGQYTLTPA